MSYFFEKRLVFRFVPKRSVARDLGDRHDIESFPESQLEVGVDGLTAANFDFPPQPYLTRATVIVNKPDSLHIPATPESAAIARERRRTMESLLNPGYADCMKEWKEEYVHKNVQYKLNGKDYLGKILSYSQKTNEIYLADFTKGYKLFVPMHRVRLLE